MSAFERVILIGFSGGGKSTIARQLADRLGWTASDVDVEIEEHFGMTIPEVFSTHGETVFRDVERSSLAGALAKDHVVVATGGGAVVQPAVWTTNLLGRPGSLVVALDVSADVVFERLRRQAKVEGSAVERAMLAG